MKNKIVMYGMVSVLYWASVTVSASEEHQPVTIMTMPWYDNETWTFDQDDGIGGQIHLDDAENDTTLFFGLKNIEHKFFWLADNTIIELGEKSPEADNNQLIPSADLIRTARAQESCNQSAAQSNPSIRINTWTTGSRFTGEKRLSLPQEGAIIKVWSELISGRPAKQEIGDPTRVSRVFAQVMSKTECKTLLATARGAFQKAIAFIDEKQSPRRYKHWGHPLKVAEDINTGEPVPASDFKSLRTVEIKL